MQINCNLSPNWGAGFQPAAAACCKLSVYSRKATISRCSKPAAAAGYKPAPQLG